MADLRVGILDAAAGDFDVARGGHADIAGDREAAAGEGRATEGRIAAVADLREVAAAVEAAAPDRDLGARFHNDRAAEGQRAGIEAVTEIAAAVADLGETVGTEVAALDDDAAARRGADAASDGDAVSRAEAQIRERAIAAVADLREGRIARASKHRDVGA